VTIIHHVGSNIVDLRKRSIAKVCSKLGKWDDILLLVADVLDVCIISKWNMIRIIVPSAAAQVSGGRNILCILMPRDTSIYQVSNKVIRGN